MVGICPNAAMFRSIGWFPGPCDIFASIHYRKLLASALGSCAKFRPVLSAVPLTQPPLSEVYAIPKRAPPAAIDTEMQETIGRSSVWRRRVRQGSSNGESKSRESVSSTTWRERTSNPLGLSAALQRQEPAGAPG